MAKEVKLANHGVRDIIMILAHTYVQKFWYSFFDRQTDPSPFRVLEPTCFFFAKQTPIWTQISWFVLRAQWP